MDGLCSFRDCWRNVGTATLAISVCGILLVTIGCQTSAYMLSREESKSLLNLPRGDREASTHLLETALDSHGRGTNWGLIAVKALRKRGLRGEGRRIVSMILDHLENPAHTDGSGSRSELFALEPEVVLPLLEAPDSRCRMVVFEHLILTYASIYKNEALRAYESEMDSETKEKMSKLLQLYDSVVKPANPGG